MKQFNHLYKKSLPLRIKGKTRAKPEKRVSNLLFIILFLLLLSPSIVFSQEKESSDSAEIDQKIIDKVKDRLEKTEEQEAEIIKNTWYSKFGLVVRSNPSSITIKTNDDKEEEIRLSPEPDLSFFQQGKATIDIDQQEIEEGWFAIALGTEITNNNNLVAKRISFSTYDENEDDRQNIIGKVSEVDENSLTIKTSNEEEVKASLAKSYKLVIKGDDDPDFEDINIDDKIIAITTTLTDQNGEQTNYLKAIYIIPGLNSPLSIDNQIEEASPSAEATESAQESTESAKTE